MLERATSSLFLIVSDARVGSEGDEVSVKNRPELLSLNCRQPVHCFPDLENREPYFKFNTGKRKLCFCYVLVYILFFCCLDTFGKSTEAIQQEGKCKRVEL